MRGRVLRERGLRFLTEEEEALDLGFDVIVRHIVPDERFGICRVDNEGRRYYPSFAMVTSPAIGEKIEQKFPHGSKSKPWDDLSEKLKRVLGDTPEFELWAKRYKDVIQFNIFCLSLDHFKAHLEEALGPIDWE